MNLTRCANRLRFIDLYAGIGGLRLPFSEAGLDCVFSSEKDHFARKTYQAFYGEHPFGDIYDVDVNSIPEFDILLAGFPCQSFSNAGLKGGLNDDRGLHIYKIAQILQIRKPSAFLLENVKGLISHDSGNTLRTILYLLNASGYCVRFDLLSALDFNLPQKRERLYFVGFRKQSQSDEFQFPLPIKKTLLVRDILELEVDEKYTASKKMWNWHQEHKTRNKKQGKGFGYTLINSESSYTNTIKSRYYKDGSEALIDQVGKLPRRLTPLEVCRLQGFPDDLVIKARAVKMSDTQLYKQLGNSVAVNVVRHLAQNIIKVLGKN